MNYNLIFAFGGWGDVYIHDYSPHEFSYDQG